MATVAVVGDGRWGWAPGRQPQSRGGGPEDVVVGQGPAVDVPEHALVCRGTRAVVDQLTRTQPDDPVPVAPRQVEEVQVDDGRDAQFAVDALEIAHDLVRCRRVEGCDRLV